MYEDPDTEPPLGWPAVWAFEKAHGVELPEPYRSFVATIAAGGKECGPPAWGLWMPGEIGDWPDYGPLRLAEPFPLESEWAWHDDDVRVDGVTVADVYTKGILPLGTDGCGQYWALIVTGSHRGQIWYLTEVGATPYGQVFGGTTAMSGFFGWVDHWYSGADWWDA
jgi:SMI1/KNR4 family protein SUKH-1